MFNPTSSYVNVRGVKLHYYRTGGDKPPLVLAHGITDDGLCWTPTAEVLANDFDIIMTDARGHGKSDAPKDGYTLRNLATDLAGVIEALDLRQPILLGHSMGAITSLLTAALFPSLPRALILEDPPPFWVDAEGAVRNNDFVNGFKIWVNSIKRKTSDELMDECRAQNSAWAEAELKPWANAKHRFDLSVVALLDPPDMVSIGFSNLLRQIICPAMLISADVERGAACGRNEIAALKSLVPHLQIAHIPQAGHNIRREQFETYIETVQNFLKEQ